MFMVFRVTYVNGHLLYMRPILGYIDDHQLDY